MTWVKSLWLTLITGYWRPETAVEADLRAQLRSLKDELAATQGERDKLASVLTVRELECKVFAEVTETARRQIAALMASATHSAAWHARTER